MFVPDDRRPPPRGRRFRPAALIVLGFAAMGCTSPTTPVAAPPPAPTTVAAAPTTTAPKIRPATTATPRVEVPKLVGLELASAKRRLASHGLDLRVRYRPTARHAAGTVISQSRGFGAAVDPSSAITLVIAKALPPPPTTQPRPQPAPASNCHPSYPGACLDPTASDYDCAGGSGNGPKYVSGPVQVRSPDPFDLDSNSDGIGCESG